MRKNIFHISDYWLSGCLLYTSGKGNDEAWKNSFELTLNPSQALKNGGFVLNRNTTSGVATAKINGVWGDKGLYFKWVVDDPTFGWVTDIQSKFFNNMDGVQLFIDPFNRGSKSYKGNSFCFDFVGFTSQSGVGQVPVHKPSWAEHWQWDGNNAYADVQIASTIVTEKDTSEYNRIEIVKSYTIEVFLPWKSLNINAKTIEDQGIKPNETTIGIGFALIDYRWDAANFNKDNIDKSQIVVNFCTCLLYTSYY